MFDWIGCPGAGTQNNCICTLEDHFRGKSNLIFSTLLSMPVTEHNFIRLDQDTSALSFNSTKSDTIESTYYLEQWATSMDELWKIDRKIDVNKLFSHNYF